MKIRLITLALLICTHTAFGLKMKADSTPAEIQKAHETIEQSFAREQEEEKARAQTYQALAQGIKQILANEQVRTELKIVLTSALQKGQFTAPVKEQAIALLNLLNEGLNLDWDTANKAQKEFYNRTDTGKKAESDKKFDQLEAELKKLKSAPEIKMVIALQRAAEVDKLIALGKKEVTIDLVQLQKNLKEIDTIAEQIQATFRQETVERPIPPAMKAVQDWQEKLMTTMSAFMQAVSTTVDFTEFAKFLVHTGLDALTSPIPGVIIPGSDAKQQPASHAPQPAVAAPIKIQNEHISSGEIYNAGPRSRAQSK